jgi:5'-deoxynucleotidase YfbR-like HD superfamily hydrolase
MVMRLDKVFGLVSGLSGTYRFSNAKLIHDESVLEHLGCVTLMCLLIISEIGDYSTDLEMTLAKAIVHDIEEVLMGDVPRTTKYHDDHSRKAFKLMELQAMKKIHYDLGLKTTDLIELHANAKKDTSGFIVKVCDVLAVVYKIHEEVIERHNKSMMSRATTVLEQIKVCEEAIDGQTLSNYGKQIILDLLLQARVMIMKAKEMATATMIAE